MSEMSVLESLLVGAMGISVVFLVLVGLSLLLRLQSALVNHFTRKKTDVVLAQESAAEIPSSEPVEVAEQLPSVEVSVPVQQPRPSSGVRRIGNGKYTVTVNDAVYEVEMEDEGIPTITRAETEQSVAAPAPAPVPKPVPKPSPAPSPKPASAPASAAAPAAGGKETVTAPVPGTVLDIKAVAGATVKRGEVLVLLEAMKMENEIVATRDGTIAQILTTKGATVEAGAPLVELQ